MGVLNGEKKMIGIKVDLVTKMVEIKHYYSDGVEAKKGIEF